MHVSLAAALPSGVAGMSTLLFLSVLACKSASETKVISHAVRQPVFLRSMSAPSDLEMIGDEDLEFTRANQRYMAHGRAWMPTCGGMLFIKTPSARVSHFVAQTQFLFSVGGAM